MKEGDTGLPQQTPVKICVGCGSFSSFFPLQTHTGLLLLSLSAFSTQTCFIGLLRLPSQVSHKTSRGTTVPVVK